MRMRLLTCRYQLPDLAYGERYLRIGEHFAELQRCFGLIAVDSAAVAVVSIDQFTRTHPLGRGAVDRFIDVLEF